MKSTLVFLLSLYTAYGVSAQPVDPLKTKALTFSFSRLDLSSPHGADVGGKFWLHDNRALVVGALGGVTRESFDYSDTASQDSKRSSYQFGVRVGLERHADLSETLSPYIVGAASARFFSADHRSVSTSGTSTSQDRTLFMEFSGGVGLEWWFTRRFSLTGQQLLQTKFDIGKSRYDGDREHNFRTFSLGVGTSTLMLNVYL